jgi:hypothetical protein
MCGCGLGFVRIFRLLSCFLVVCFFDKDMVDIRFDESRVWCSGWTVDVTGGLVLELSIEEDSTWGTSRRSVLRFVKNVGDTVYTTRLKEGGWQIKSARVTGVYQLFEKSAVVINHIWSAVCDDEKRGSGYWTTLPLLLVDRDEEVVAKTIECCVEVRGSTKYVCAFCPRTAGQSREFSVARDYLLHLVQPDMCVVDEALIESAGLNQV